MNISIKFGGGQFFCTFAPVFLLLYKKIMSLAEQQEYRTKHYAEAMRYIENAYAALQNARKEDNIYHDKKYSRSACGIAYLGVLAALDAFLTLRGVEMPKKKRRSIEFYTSNLATLDGKMTTNLHTVYETLHLSGYYDGIQDARVIKAGFEVAQELIDQIKPLTINTEE
jgi:hypothetical protein